MKDKFDKLFRKYAWGRIVVPPGTCYTHILLFYKLLQTTISLFIQVFEKWNYFFQKMFYEKQWAMLVVTCQWGLARPSLTLVYISMFSKEWYCCTCHTLSGYFLLVFFAPTTPTNNFTTVFKFFNNFDIYNFSIVLYIIGSGMKYLSSNLMSEFNIFVVLRRYERFNVIKPFS